MPPQAILTPLILHAVQYFDAAARHQSFTRAAEEMHVTQGAISQQIKGMEEQIGVRLFRRLPRGLVLTPEGEQLHNVVRKLLQNLETELRAIQPGVAQTTLAIRSSPSFSMMWLMPRLASFSQRHPDIAIRLRGELFGMSAARMNSEAIDILVLYEQLPLVGDQEVVELMSEYLLPVATADYLARHAPITCRADLKSHTLLHDDSPWEAAPPYAEWLEWLKGAPQNSQNDAEDIGKHGHQYNLSQLAVNAALQGQGIAMTRASLILEELRSGQLVPALPHCVRASAAYCLVFNAQSGKNQATQIFREWITEECRRFEAERGHLLAALTGPHQ